MILSPEQERAIVAIQRWSNEGFYQTAKPFILAGYAGTGKTTLMQYFINQQDEPVLCCAPTGKAASVLQAKLTNAKVCTVHSALYKPVSASVAHLQLLESMLLHNPNDIKLQQQVLAERQRLSKRNVTFALKEETSILPGQLVIVDEASMVTRKMQEDFAATGARVIFVGDPGQLPPVMDKGFFETFPIDAMLSEVQRQAYDSPIIRTSMQIREGRSIPYNDAGAFRRMRKTNFPYARWNEFDQIITGSNISRKKINAWFRRQKWPKPSWWPSTGDKLICLNNELDNGIYFVNGIQAVATSDCIYDLDNDLMGAIKYEGAEVVVSFYRYPFQSHYDPKAVETPKQMLFGSGLKQFDYAYAITVHKSQGSEWNRVLIADDQMNNGGSEFRKRWLYTAVTRAKEELLWLD